MATAQAGSDAIAAHSAQLRKDLGLLDLTLTQVLFIVGLPWVGVAAKQGTAHVLLWLTAIVFFYLPSALVVIYLNRANPLEGGLYQWAKLGFGELTGFLVAWNLWLFAILNTSETGIQVTQYFRYVLGPDGERLTGARWFVIGVSLAIFTALVILTIRGLSVGRWVHKIGAILMLTTFAMLIGLPWLNVAHGTLQTFHPLVMTMPVMSVLSLNIAAKMGFGALGGFEYVAIHAGECRNPEQSIARSVHADAPSLSHACQFDPVRRRRHRGIQRPRVDWRWQTGGLPAALERFGHLLRAYLPRHVRAADCGSAGTGVAQNRRALRVPDDAPVRRDLDSSNRAGREPVPVCGEDQHRGRRRQRHRNRDLSQVLQGSTGFYQVLLGSFYRSEREADPHFSLEQQEVERQLNDQRSD